MNTANARHVMVDEHLRPRGIRDPRVLDAMGSVPREKFVPLELVPHAYADRPLPIGAGQTISQPYIVALMAEALALQPTDTVLEVGTGSGYAAAVLSILATRVYTIERHFALADIARERLHRLGYANVEVRRGDGTLGWPDAAPFDAISVAAGGPEVPPSLVQQLAVGGRLVIPIGPEDQQRLVRITRLSPTEVVREDLGDVMFVPLIGEEGWSEEGWSEGNDNASTQRWRRQS
jgi:protein-L-isoaspartate(D-aspartate) O-methyltransferase